jgi:hypothetical protein
MGSARGRGVILIVEAAVLSDRRLKKFGSRELIWESLWGQAHQRLGGDFVELAQSDRRVSTGNVTQ